VNQLFITISAGMAIDLSEKNKFKAGKSKTSGI
jgi:hypothetical protein